MKEQIDKNITSTGEQTDANNTSMKKPADTNIASMKERAGANTVSTVEQVNQDIVSGMATIKDDRLNAIYQQYVRLTDALVKGNITDAKIAGNAIRAGVEETSESASLKASAEKIVKATDIESQRKAYAGMSAELIALVKNAGLSRGELYVSYCPMVFDDEGASWLSTNKKISNPYFGDKMLTCGEIKETIR